MSRPDTEFVLQRMQPGENVVVAVDDMVRESDQRVVLMGSGPLKQQVTERVAGLGWIWRGAQAQPGPTQAPGSRSAANVLTQCRLSSVPASDASRTTRSW